ncbi:MAG TPA: acyl-CoA dehydrogenase family protein [Solirubrobacteraceae bacterium]|jgi:acyl-CoA dehydrogenase|nr:acyl-CoA dehydrogenase family protein [Solirubrobacteraceae bacterium]
MSPAVRQLNTADLAAVASEIGQRVAAPAAGDVDQAARFPAETVAELRRSGLLGALVPTERGGAGASVQQLGQAVAALAEHCASSGLVLAMHGIQVACLVRHAVPATLDRVVPGLVSGELLLANANSEVGLGGERRTSLCALEPAGGDAGDNGGGDGDRDVGAGRLRLEKRASTVSYGEYADGVLATARREPDSPPHEQVFAICLASDYTLVPNGEWDTLGLRGTCSRPALLTATLDRELVIDNYADVFARTSLGASAILLSSVWLGIAEAAARRAHAVVRAQGRKLRAANPDAPPPPGALRLAELTVLLHQLRAVVGHGAHEYERLKDTPEVATLRFSGHMDSVKVSSSTLVNDVVRQAMSICGLPGYFNTTPASLGRLSRDAAAAPLMVNNDRALLANAQSLLIRKEL